MTSLLGRSIEFWHSLQQRERNIIVTGLGLVLAVALYLSFSALNETRVELKGKIKEVNEEMVWGREQSKLLANLDNSCARKVSYSVTGSDLVNKLAAEAGLTVTSMSGSVNQGYTLMIATANGNNILRFAHDTACAGLYLTEMSINQDESNAAISYKGRLKMTEDPQGIMFVDSNLNANSGLYWRWFSNQGVESSSNFKSSDEELENATISGELLGVIVASEFSAATIKLNGQAEKVYHVGDDLGRGVVIKEITVDRVIVEERGKRLQIPLDKFKPLPSKSLETKVRSSADGRNIARAEMLSIPNLFSAETVAVENFNAGLRVDGLSDDLKAIADIRSGDVVVRVGSSGVEELIADPALWVNFSAEPELPITIIRDGEEITIYVDAFSVSAKLLPAIANFSQ